MAVAGPHEKLLIGRDAHKPVVNSPTPYGSCAAPQDIAEHMPVSEAAGHVAAKPITPYPPGTPAVLPGERLNEPVLRYLRTGLAAGMSLPDAGGPELEMIRVLVTDC